MNPHSMYAALAGGIGLFLLGMWLMTDGLKLAAGPALQRILARSTGTRARALVSGITVTAVVQSSSAVTVAAIGFVNAGLLTLGPALWVLFGANVGTTMTGWLVAISGIGFKIETAALPLIGIGMLLHLTGSSTRRGAIGMTLAGFGALFLGIEILKSGFTGMAAQFSLPGEAGLLTVLAHVAAGAVMTVLMQSSSAALAVALTAAQGGLLSLQAAAGVVIGANLGTTVTAVIAALGATANAKRAAAAHVAFNLLTGMVALLVLPWLLDAIVALRDAIELEPSPATTLALFHTVFNILGVILMWPAAARLTAWLERRFRSAEEDDARPHYLDANAAAVPTLGLAALEREIVRLGDIAQGALRQALADADAAAVGLALRRIERVKPAVEQFIARLNRGSMSADSAARLPQLLRVWRYYDTVGKVALEIAAHARTPPLAGTFELPAALHAYFAHADALSARLMAHDSPAPDDIDTGIAALEQEYQQLKAMLLQSGAIGRLGMAEMDVLLRRCSLVRRGAEQAVKAARALAALNRQPPGAASPAPGTASMDAV